MKGSYCHTVVVSTIVEYPVFPEYGVVINMLLNQHLLHHSDSR